MKSGLRSEVFEKLSRIAGAISSPEVMEWKKKGGKVIGYKPYPPRHLIPITDPRHEPGMQWCEDNEAPVLCHAGPVDHVITLAQKYPHAKFLIAHSGMDWGFAERVADAATGHELGYRLSDPVRLRPHHLAQDQPGLDRSDQFHHGAAHTL